MSANVDGKACDVCGADLPLVYARVSVGWSFESEGRTLHGGPLDPDSTKRVMCPACFSRMAETTATRLGGEDGGR